MALFVITAFIHAVDGLKVVVDDYVHDEGSRLLFHGLLTFAGDRRGRRSPCSALPRSPLEAPPE